MNVPQIAVHCTLRVMRNLLLVFSFVVAVRALGNYPGKDLWLPVAGHAAGADGRVHSTTVFITNTSDEPVDVKMSLHAPGEAGKEPNTVAVRIAGGGTHVHDAAGTLATPSRPIGALRITASQPVVADAWLHQRWANRPGTTGSVIGAIPAEFAIGSGESAFMHASTKDARFKLYVAETRGFPLYFSVTARDAHGRRTSAHRYFVDRYDQRSWEIPGSFVTLSVTGLNGSGKIIFAGSGIDDASQDTSFFAMTLPALARHRIGALEWTVYALAAAALLAAALKTWRDVRDFAPPDRP